MTVNVYSGPGTSAYESSKFTVGVNGSNSYCYGLTRTTGLQCRAWTLGQSVEISWVKFTTNETVATVSVGISGTITSAVVYPKNVVTQVIVGGVLILGSVPPNTRLRVEVNGDEANVLHVFSEPLPRAVGTTTNYTTLPKTVSSINTGTNVVTMGAAHGWSAGQRVKLSTTGTLPAVTGTALSVHEALWVVSPSGADLQLARTSGGAAIDFTSGGTGTLSITRADWTSGALYFGTGVHTISRGFVLSAGTRVYIDANAVVIGSFDWRGISGTGPIVEGAGTLLGDFATSEAVQLLSTFGEKILYSMFLGYDGTKFNYDTEVQGITIARTPFYTDFVAVNRYANVQLISPWYYECNGLQVCGKSASEPTSSIVDCFSFSGDDNLTMGEQVTAFGVEVSGCFLVTMANSNIHLNYWSQIDYGYSNTFDDIDFLHLGIVDNPGNSPFPVYGGNCHIKCWSDGYIGQEQDGRFNCTFTNLRFWGPHESRWLMLANRDYPFDDYDDAQTRDLRGQIANFTFDGVMIEDEPGQLSVITGLDWLNTPHDIAFKGVEIAGVGLRVTNFSDYFTTNVYPYSITVEGHPLVTSVDISNRALDLIGHQKRITALGPSDGSAEALTCLDHYSDSVNQLLEMREWNFATVKRELVALDESDDPAYDYCYEVPAGMLKAISVLEDGASDNNLRNGREVAPQEYDIHADTDDVVRIYTDVGDAWLRFTKYVTDPNLFPPTFLNALYWLLAANIAGPIIKGAEGSRERDRCMQMFSLAMAEASKIDAQQQKPTTNKPLASWHLRGGAQ